jgi:pyruvate,water dikinase
LELGKRLAGAGVFAAPEDIFHLRFEELQRIGAAWPPDPAQIAELQALVERRKQKRQRLEHMPVVDPRLYQPIELDREALLTGTPGSPGTAEGPVCIITSAGEFGRLQAGDVLVAPYTNPAWTPLFQRAAAVIVDGGAAGSHAAIVAREYGVPAVMGTVDGTRRLVDGQRVRVDGSRGLVFNAENESTSSG